MLTRQVKNRFILLNCLQQTAVDLRPGLRKSNSDPNAVYANITMLPLSPLPDKTYSRAAASQGDSHQNVKLRLNSTFSVD